MILEESEYREHLYELATAVKLEDKGELKTFINELVSLTNEGYLKCCSGRNEICQILLDDLEPYIKGRIAEGKKLTDEPTEKEWEKEYSWRTTESGLKLAKLYKKEYPNAGLSN
jgi:hypothetical protein